MHFCVAACSPSLIFISVQRSKWRLSQSNLALVLSSLVSSIVTTFRSYYRLVVKYRRIQNSPKHNVKKMKLKATTLKSAELLIVSHVLLRNFETQFQHKMNDKK